MKENKWIRLLAYVTGLVNQELLAQNEYLSAESDFTCAAASAFALIRSGEIHLGRNRQANWAQGSGPGGLRGQAGHDFGLVPETDCPEVRRLETPSLPRQTANRTEAGGADRCRWPNRIPVGDTTG